MHARAPRHVRSRDATPRHVTTRHVYGRFRASGEQNALIDQIVRNVYAIPAELQTAAYAQARDACMHACTRCMDAITVRLDAIRRDLHATHLHRELTLRA